MRGDGRLVDKAGHRFSVDARIEITTNLHNYVGRGGLKLEHALDYFAINPQGLVCMDVGASTGGFTDCLLKGGAAKVYAVDVGYGQLDWRLRNNKRVVTLERTNIRYLSPGALDSLIHLVTVDTSFISLRLVIPPVMLHMHRQGCIIALVKPQFEVGKKEIGRHGIVKDPKLHQMVLESLKGFFSDELGLTVSGITPSPILGTKGNREFFMLIGHADQNHGDIRRRA